MKRRGTSRLLVAVLVVAPALLVAAAYAWWFGLPLRAQIERTEAQIRAVQASLPSTALVQQVNDRADALRADLAEIVAARKPAPASGQATFVPSAERAQWRLLLSDTLQKHGLVLVAEERTELDLPANIARGLTGAAVSRTHVSAWSLQVRGAYLALLAAVGELRSAAVPFHLLELGMRRDGAGQVTWTMVVG